MGSRGFVYLRIILVTLRGVLLIIHVLNVVTCLALGLFTVDPVGTLGLGELIDLSTCETDEELLGELVGNGLAYEVQMISIVA